MDSAVFIELARIVLDEFPRCQEVGWQVSPPGSLAVPMLRAPIGFGDILAVPQSDGRLRCQLAIGDRIKLQRTFKPSSLNLSGWIGLVLAKLDGKRTRGNPTRVRQPSDAKKNTPDEQVWRVSRHKNGSGIPQIEVGMRPGIITLFYDQNVFAQDRWFVRVQNFGDSPTTFSSTLFSTFDDAYQHVQTCIRDFTKVPPRSLLHV